MRHAGNPRFFVVLMGGGGLAMYLPAVHGYALSDHRTALIFFQYGTLCLFVAGLVVLAMANRQWTTSRGGGLVVLMGTFAALPLILALPVNGVVAETSFFNAWFEMISAFTTTGATVLDQSVSAPPSVHLWRGLVAWFGGGFAWLTAIAVLAPMNLGGYEVTSFREVGEGSDRTGEVADMGQRLARFGRLLFPVYLALTLLLWIGLLIVGEHPFRAAMLAMATLSTSGVVPPGFAQSPSVRAEILIFAFLVFALSRQSFAMDARSLRPALAGGARRLLRPFVGGDVGLLRPSTTGAGRLRRFFRPTVKRLNRFIKPEEDPSRQRFGLYAEHPRGSFGGEAEVLPGGPGAGAERLRRRAGSSSESRQTDKERLRRTIAVGGGGPRRLFGWVAERLRRLFGLEAERPRRSFKGKTESLRAQSGAETEHPRRPAGSASRRSNQADVERLGQILAVDAGRSRWSVGRAAETPRQLSGVEPERPRRLSAGEAGRSRWFTLWRDDEFRLGLLLVVLISIGLFLHHFVGAIEVDDAADPKITLAAFWGGMFTVASFLTTAGFESGFWDTARSWSGLRTPGIILMGLAVFGGGVATTAGGVKLMRVVALYRHGLREMEKLVHPNSVGGSGDSARRIRREGARVAWIFFMLFALSIALVMAALTLTGLAFDAALILSLAALTTTGPMATTVADPAISYAMLPDAAKAVLMAAMVLGRMETLVVIALFNPEFWRS